MGSEKLTRTLQTSPPPLQFFSSPKLRGFCILKKTKPPKALHSHSSPFFPLLPSFFKPSPPFPSTPKQSLMLLEKKVVLHGDDIFFRLKSLKRDAFR